ncbi:hypothetical protein SI65_10140 [Aspergillus cristatus]|uniref:FAD/NAD(P)-binding domain-containing protein n=1 Tax=Aspergillus cristatus TaxID=573508 RepID=A0A1E3B0F6_ASPCR|nr:hypothetical protein SI65_10140 [Aspergillus cristatus]
MAPKPAQHIDILIVGAGFGGIGQAYALRNLGLSIKVVDSLPDVGGTWLTNIYPGALSDTESFVYRFSWDAEDLQTYHWSRRYLQQPEILACLRHFVERLDLRKYMQFNMELQSAKWVEETGVWEVRVNTGEIYWSRYFIPAMGVLSKPNFPDIPGIESFKGRITHTSHWPADLDVTNKRVGVLGCGASGVQVITNIAPHVSPLTVFIRRPQYALPSNDRPITPAYRTWANKHYDQIWAQIKTSFVGFGYVESDRLYFSVDPHRREQLLEDLWSNGNGLRFMVEHFCNITTNADANDAVCDFIRRKTYQIVNDPEKARKLIPNERFARRPISNDGYYETFNRENVSIVDLKETPIEEITTDGIRTADGTCHVLDVIILATGFDAVEGNLIRANTVGRDGVALKDAWAKGPKSYLGSFAAGFPNMFMVNGPKGALGMSFRQSRLVLSLSRMLSSVLSVPEWSMVLGELWRPRLRQEVSGVRDVSKLRKGAFSVR